MQHLAEEDSDMFLFPFSRCLLDAQMQPKLGTFPRTTGGIDAFTYLHTEK